LNFITEKKPLFKNIQNAGLYFAGSIVQSVLAIIAQPIYSIYLSSEEFGIIGYFAAIQSFFTPIFILGMTSIYLMRYFKQSEIENKKLLFNITFYLLIINTITIFIGYVGIYFYFRRMGINIPLNPFAWYILIALLLNNITSVVLINFRIRKKALSYFTFSSLSSILNVGIGLLFVAVFKWGAEGRMLAPIISHLFFVPYCIYILQKHTIIYFNFKLFIKELRVISPFVLAAYAYVPVTNIDRIFLERLNNLSELGLYNIGITIAGYAQLANVALALAFEPDIFQSVAQKNYKKLFKIFTIMFIPYSLAILTFMLFSETIISLLTAGRYIDAKVYTNIALIAVFFMGVFSFISKIFVALEKTKLNLVTNVIGGLSSIVIMYFAVTKYGYIGAAYGKILISLIMAIAAMILLRKCIYKAT